MGEKRQSSENLSFTDRVIRELQRRPSNPDRLFVEALTEYLLQQGRIAFQDTTGLFWVIPSTGSPQAAIWMPMLDPVEATA